jgi:hypothetical protein
MKTSNDFIITFLIKINVCVALGECYSRNVCVTDFINRSTFRIRHLLRY